MVSSANRRDFKILHVDSGLLRSVPPGPALLTGSLVCCKVEGDEEEEVRAEDGHASKGSKFLAGASAVVWHVGEVGGSEVGIGCKVHESYDQTSGNEMKAGSLDNIPRSITN